MKLIQAIALSNLRLRLVVALLALIVTGVVALAAEQRDSERFDGPEQGMNPTQESRVQPS